MDFLIVLGATYATVFLKGFQHKNVIANLYTHTFVTSMAMAAADAVVVGLLAKAIALDQNYYIILASAIGGSVGMISAMWVHNTFVRGKSHVLS